MIGFAKRNLKVYFKDKTAVFFSLLSVVIVIVLYVLFLGNSWLGMFEEQEVEGVSNLMDSWIIAGLLTVTAVTTSMGAFGAMVEDGARKINKDFVVSPMKSYKIMGGYVLSAVIVGIIMSLFTLVLSQIYVAVKGGEILGILALVKVVLIIILSTFTIVSMVLFLVSFIKSQSAFAAASTILGTLIGFVTGVYMPIGDLSESVQIVMKVFPISHSGALFRQVFTAKPIEVTFVNAPQEVITAFQEKMGVVYTLGEHTITSFESILILIATGIIFFGLSVLVLKRKAK